MGLVDVIDGCGHVGMVWGVGRGAAGVDRVG